MTRDLREMWTWLASLDVEAIAIAYAPHCTSLGPCETFSNRALFDNLTPLAFFGGSGPGSSGGIGPSRCINVRAEDPQRARLRLALY